MARTKKAPDPLDGAQYWTKDAKVEDYLADETTGLRPGQKTKPQSSMKTDLTMASIAHVTFPPRSIWREGKWKSDVKEGKAQYGGDDYATWIVSGEGTPGNFVYREYLLPSLIAADQVPKHPADWPASAKKKTTGTKTTKDTGPSLPFGIRFRDPACGHWFKESDLAGHAQVCPAKEGGESDWAIECQCCHSLDDTAKCKPGFPRPKPEPKPEAKKEKAVTTDGGSAPAA